MPGRIRDPCPIEAAWLIVQWLLLKNQAFYFWCALAVVLQVDTCAPGRPAGHRERGPAAADSTARIALHRLGPGSLSQHTGWQDQVG
eukprot:8054698-Pyramimonas_sp.AAC.1